MKPRVRFAPSPTGIPHIGNTRTALFNFLFTKNLGGDFVLRIEDTDRERYVPESLKAIIKILKLVGISYDEGPGKGGEYEPYEQSKRLKLYRRYANNLVKKRAAYYCFCSKERLDSIRKKQQKKGLIPKYDGFCRNLKSSDVKERVSKGKSYVVRLKVSREGRVSWVDLVQGKIEFENRLVDDQVLLKSDGYPTYHLGVVVDDHLMKISHTLRGAEWISSTPKQIMLYKAFGWKLPKFGHFSVILGPDKAKLSKRHGAKSILDYVSDGYLIEALVSFMAYLGWSYKDNSELLSLSRLIKLFDIKNAQKQNPIFDIRKLNYFNGKAIRDKNINELVDLVKPFLPKEWMVKKEKLFKVMPLIYERMVKLTDVKLLAEFFFIAPKVIKKEILKQSKHSSDETAFFINKMLKTIEEMNVVDNKTLEDSLRLVVSKLSWKPRQAFMTLRLALTGKEATPPLFETMEVIGKKEIINRLSNAKKILQ